MATWRLRNPSLPVVKLLRLIFCACLWLGVVSISLAQGGYRITNMDVQIRLNPDRSLDVTENISILFTESRQGIFREIPEVYPGAGKERRIRVDRISVAGFESKVTRAGSDVRIRIGTKGTFLEPGTQLTYPIRYRVTGALNFFEAREAWEPWTELYWNLTGDRWTAPVEKASFLVVYPESGEKAQAQLYYGARGSNSSLRLTHSDQIQVSEDGLVKARFSGSQVSGEVTQPLDLGAGITLVLGVPQAVVPPPTQFEKIMEAASEAWGFLIPLVAIVILFPVWLVKGRDPKLGPAGVRFEPPEDVAPAFCGVLIDDRVDGRDLSAGIMGLAVKGYLKFGTTQRDGRFSPDTSYIRSTDKPVGKDLTPWEQDLLHALSPPFDKLSMTDLQNRLRYEVPSLARKLRAKLVDRGYYRRDPQETKSAIWGAVFTVGMIAFFFGGALINLLFTRLASTNVAAISVGLGIVGTLIVIAIFAHLMPARTYLGAKKHQEAKAFFEAMRYRGHYMTWVSKTNLDLAKYEEYLPYAVAFGLVKEWSSICGSVLTEMPSFFDSPGVGFDWNTYWFVSSLDNSLHSISRSLDASSLNARGSDGSWGGDGNSAWSGGSGFDFGDGGGFSGGGFGGGGGDSW